MLKFDKITIHCSDTPPEMDIGAEKIRDWHVNGNGWRDIGYHFVITRSGHIEDGRPIDQEGAHVGGHNKGNIGICLVGGEKGKFDYYMGQMTALQTLVNKLRYDYGKDIEVLGHRDLDSGKTCPNFNVKAFFGEL